jgi:hypothetical protein
MSKPLTQDEWQSMPDKQAALRIALQEPVVQDALATLRQMARPRTWSPITAEGAGLKLFELTGWLDALDAFEALGEPPEKSVARTDGVTIGGETRYPEEIAEMTPEEQIDFLTEQTKPQT